MPGQIASLNAVVAEARGLWDGAAPILLSVRNPGDAAGYVSIYRPAHDRITAVDEAAYFDAATGTLLHRRLNVRPGMAAQQFISGSHLIRFRDWSPHWLYFGLGLAGCVTIATGYLFWLESRRKKHAQLGLSGVPIVESLTIGSVTGIVIATLAFFVVNRLLPLGATFVGYDRAALEIWTFYLVWLATFANAHLRPGQAWIEQCWAIAGLAMAAVGLNWLTTGDQLIRSLSHRHLWPIADTDLPLLACAAITALTARNLQHGALKRAALSSQKS